MKIDKTEKEFQEAVDRAGVGLRRPVADTVPLADALKDALDLEFREEEPELPERVRAQWSPTECSVLLPEASSYEHTTDEEHDALTREAAARYNAAGRFIRRYEKTTVGMSGSVLLQMLSEERERLQ